MAIVRIGNNEPKRTMATSNFVVTGYPTYVIIDREMTIVNPDLWPFNEGVIEDLL